MASLSSKTSLTEWFEERKLKPELIPMIIDYFGMQTPDEFEEYDDADVQEFIATNKLGNRLQNKRLMNAYREIKYNEGNNSSLSRSRSSTRSSFESFGETTAFNGNEIVIQNYLIFTRKSLRDSIDGHCDVVLAETNDMRKTPLVAKIATDVITSESLEREYQILQHLRSTIGQSANDVIVELLNWIAKDGSHDHIMLLERGELNGDLGKIFKGGFLNQMDDLPCINIAKNLLQIGQCLAKCGIVWGDVKPGNFVSFKIPGNMYVYKAIDFDSARRDVGVGASLRGPGFLSDEFSSDDTTVMVTRGYVSPERAEAIKENRSIKADTRQDVFVVGLIIYQLFAKCPYFSPKVLENEGYLNTLISDSFVADLSAVHRKDLKKLLGEMLERIPSRRKTFGDLLKHRVFDATSSVSVSQLARRSDVRAVEVKIDAVLSLQQRLVETSERSLEMLQGIEENQLRIMEHLDRGFAGLTNHMDIAIQTIGNAVQQLMINLQQSDLPMLFLCVPTDLNDTDGFLSWCGGLKQRALRKVGWKKYVTLYVCDEGPLLLPSKIPRREEPAHTGIDFELPGPLMVKLAPLLYVFSKLLEIASIAGKMFGIPLPSTVPGLGNVLKDAKKLKEMSRAFERIAALSDQLGNAKEMVDALKSNVDAQLDDRGETRETRETLASVQKTMKSSYGALMALLNEKKAAKSWAEFQAKGEMEKVYRKSDGWVHWVRASDVEVVLATELYRADARHTQVQYIDKDSSDDGLRNTRETKEAREEKIKATKEKETIVQGTIVRFESSSEKETIVQGTIVRFESSAAGETKISSLPSHNKVRAIVFFLTFHIAQC